MRELLRASADIVGVGMAIIKIEIEADKLAVYFDDGSVARVALTPEELQEIEYGGG